MSCKIPFVVGEICAQIIEGGDEKLELLENIDFVEKASPPLCSNQ